MPLHHIALDRRVFIVASVSMLLPSLSGAADPLEQMMAKIDAGRIVRKDDIRITRFRYLLNSLHDASGVDEKVIADKIAAIKRAMHDQFGKDVLMLDMLEAINERRDVAR